MVEKTENKKPVFLARKGLYKSMSRTAAAKLTAASGPPGNELGQKGQKQHDAGAGYAGAHAGQEHVKQHESHGKKNSKAV